MLVVVFHQILIIFFLMPLFVIRWKFYLFLCAFSIAYDNSSILAFLAFIASACMLVDESLSFLNIVTYRAKQRWLRKVVGKNQNQIIWHHYQKAIRTRITQQLFMQNQRWNRMLSTSKGISKDNTLLFNDCAFSCVSPGQPTCILQIYIYFQWNPRVRVKGSAVSRFG